LEVAAALTAAGHRSLVVSAGGPMVAELEAGGSEHFACPIGRKSPGTLRWIGWLSRLMDREGVDVVDYHSRLPGWMTLAALRLLPRRDRPRCVSSLHGLHSVNAYSSVMCRGEHVVVVSQTLESYAVRHFRSARRRPRHLIYRGIDDAQFPRDYRPRRGWCDAFYRAFPESRDRQRIAIVGRLTRLKGHHDFVELMARLRSAGRNVHGLIVGGADPRKQRYQNELRAEIARRGLSDRISWTGPRRDVKEIYSQCDAVVSLSHTPESFGRTVAESLAIGTPVIGYDHGGVAEILAAQFPDGAVPLGRLDALTERVAWVLDQRDRLTIRPNHFSLAEMQRRTIALYEWIASGADRGPGEESTSGTAPQGPPRSSDSQAA
jgi:glycosyltransferase involved in cell wall biosynthesis